MTIKREPNFDLQRPKRRLRRPGQPAAPAPPAPEEEESEFLRPPPATTFWDIPRNKNYPGNSVQCDACGGWGLFDEQHVGKVVCSACLGRGWLTPATHPDGRRCENPECGKPLPPNLVAVYCSNDCALDDA